MPANRYPVLARDLYYIIGERHAEWSGDTEIAVFRSYTLPVRWVLKRTLCDTFGIVVIDGEYISRLSVLKMTRLQYDIVPPSFANRLGAQQNSALGSRQRTDRCAEYYQQ